MQEIPYNREVAVAYARRWALGRNIAYYDFENIGGDCTNFASQCIYAGTPTILIVAHMTHWTDCCLLMPMKLFAFFTLKEYESRSS